MVEIRGVGLTCPEPADSRVSDFSHPFCCRGRDSSFGAVKTCLGIIAPAWYFFSLPFPLGRIFGRDFLSGNLFCLGKAVKKEEMFTNIQGGQVKENSPRKTRFKTQKWAANKLHLPETILRREDVHITGKAMVALKLP